MKFWKQILITLWSATLVTNAQTAPVISLSLSGSNALVNVSNGVAFATNILLTATNPSTPMSNWIAIGTNVFDTNGRGVFTNTFARSASQFFASEMLPLPANSPDLWVPPCGALLGTVVTNETPALVAQHEAQIGRSLDVLRIYHTPGSWTALTATEKSYLTAGRKLLLSVKPDSQWSNAVGVANGGSAVIDSQMKTLAQSIASVQPSKVMLIVWHEPENDVIGSVPTANAGTTAQYVMMWHNVRNIFDASGATNVIWCWCVENYAPLRYLLPALWPGNTNVDWVMWDQYQSSDKNVYSNVLQDGYNWMTTNSSATTDYLSKAWGLGEWGVGVNSYYPTVADQTNGMQSLTDALNQHNQFPRLKLIEYFDELAATILPDAFNTYSNFANSPYMKQQCSP